MGAVVLYTRSIKKKICFAQEVYMKILTMHQSKYDGISSYIDSYTVT